jgi:transcriptional regulator with XRE-family HTH domain
MPRQPKRRLTLTKPVSEAPIIESKTQNFARILQHEMLKRGWSQSDLARAVWGAETTDSRGFRAAVGRDRISAYVNSKATPEPATLKKIADVLGLSPEALAPDIATMAVARDNPSIDMRVVAGREDHAWLRVNRIVSLSTAARVITLLENDGK